MQWRCYCCQIVFKDEHVGNELVHGLSTPDTKEMEAMIAELKKLMAIAKIDIA